MFTSRHLVEWLTDRISSDAEVVNDTIPPSGRIIYVRLQPGPGYDLEGVQDNMIFTLECRGADRNFDDAEYIAREADLTILKYGKEGYEFSDGTYMYAIERAGGGPGQIPVADIAGRYIFTCNYIVTVATDL